MVRFRPNSCHARGVRELERKDRSILQIFLDMRENHTLDFRQSPAVCALARDCGASMARRRGAL